MAKLTVDQLRKWNAVLPAGWKFDAQHFVMWGEKQIFTESAKNETGVFYCLTLDYTAESTGTGWSRKATGRQIPMVSIKRYTPSGVSGLYSVVHIIEEAAAAPESKRKYDVLVKLAGTIDTAAYFRRAAEKDTGKSYNDMSDFFGSIDGSDDSAAEAAQDAAEEAAPVEAAADTQAEAVAAAVRTSAAVKAPDNAPEMDEDFLDFDPQQVKRMLESGQGNAEEMLAYAEKVLAESDAVTVAVVDPVAVVAAVCSDCAAVPAQDEAPDSDTGRDDDSSGGRAGPDSPGTGQRTAAAPPGFLLAAVAVLCGRAASSRGAPPGSGPGDTAFPFLNFCARSAQRCQVSPGYHDTS